MQFAAERMEIIWITGHVIWCLEYRNYLLISLCSVFVAAALSIGFFVAMSWTEKIHFIGYQLITCNWMYWLVCVCGSWHKTFHDIAISQLSLQWRLSKHMIAIFFEPLFSCHRFTNLINTYSHCDCKVETNLFSCFFFMQSCGIK